MQFQKRPLCKKNYTNIFTVLKPGAQIFFNINLKMIFSSSDIFPLLKSLFHQNNKILTSSIEWRIAIQILWISVSIYQHRSANMDPANPRGKCSSDSSANLSVQTTFKLQLLWFSLHWKRRATVPTEHGKGRENPGGNTLHNYFLAFSLSTMLAHFYCIIVFL